MAPKRTAKTWVAGTRPATGGALLVVRDLDQVLVRVANVDRLDRADGAGAWSRPGDDRHVALLQMRDDLGEGRRGDEAQIGGAGRGSIGDQAGDVVGRVQIDLLLAEAQRGAAL